MPVSNCWSARSPCCLKRKPLGRCPNRLTGHTLPSAIVSSMQRVVLGVFGLRPTSTLYKMLRKWCTHQISPLAHPEVKQFHDCLADRRPPGFRSQTMRRRACREPFWRWGSATLARQRPPLPRRIGRIDRKSGSSAAPLARCGKAGAREPGSQRMPPPDSQAEAPPPPCLCALRLQGWFWACRSRADGCCSLVGWPASSPMPGRRCDRWPERWGWGGRS